MAGKIEYDVHRAMHGDGRDYTRGDTRTMSDADAAALVATGALAKKGEKPIVRAAGAVHGFGQLEIETGDRITLETKAPRTPRVKD